MTVFKNEGVAGASMRIQKELSRWKGLETGPHRFGGIEYRVFGTEIGHTHGNHQADIRFNRQLSAELVAAGRADPHHLMPESGWISFYIRKEADVERAITLFREAYQWICERKGPKA